MHNSRAVPAVPIPNCKYGFRCTTYEDANSKYDTSRQAPPHNSPSRIIGIVELKYFSFLFPPLSTCSQLQKSRLGVYW